MRAGDPTPDFLRFRATGDPGALARVFDAVAPRMLLLALHLTRNRADAEDAVQETFVAAIDAAAEFDPRRDVRAWLSGILARRARELRRRRARRPDPERLRAAEERTPLDAAADGDALEQVDRAIDALPQATREVLVLRLHHGLTGREIARALGRSVDTVHTQIRRGMEALRQRLPAGLAAVLVRLEEPGRGLSSVREAVLGRVTTPVAAAAPLVLGGVLVKKLVVACVAALAVAVVITQPWRGAEVPAVGPVAGGGPAVRSRSIEDGSTGTSPEPVRELVAEEPPVAPDAAPAFEITGRCVEYRTGDPIAGCRFLLDMATSPGALSPDRQRIECKASSGPDGRFRIELPARPPSSVTLGAFAEGFLGTNERVPVRDDDETHIEVGTIRLARGWKPTGVVVLRDGKPAPAEATVALWCEGPDGRQHGLAWCEPGPSGRFACTWMLPAGPVRAQAIDGWHVVSIDPPQYDGNGPPPVLRIVVEAMEGSLAGVVLDENEVPIPQAIVMAYELRATGRPGDIVGETQADDQGEFEMEARRPYSGPVLIEISDDEWRPIPAEQHEVRWGDQEVRVVALRRNTLHLEVVEAIDGEPVPVIQLDSFPPGTFGPAERGPAGHYELQFVAGTHDIVLAAESMQRGPYAWLRIEMPADQGRTIRVELPRPEDRVVRVRRPDGTPIEGSEVLVVRANVAELDDDARLCRLHRFPTPPPADADGVVQSTGTTDENGEAQCAIPRPSNDVWLIVRGHHRPAVVRLDESEGTELIDIVVDRGRIVAGRVVPPDASVRLGGDVRVVMRRVDDGRVRRAASIGSDGRFELADVADGAWHCGLSRSNGPLSSGLTDRYHELPEPVVVSEETLPLRIDAASIVAANAPGSLSVRVLRDGLPVENGTFILEQLEMDEHGKVSCPVQFYNPSPSDASGLVRFDDVPPGHYRLQDPHSAGRPLSDEVLEVRPDAITTATATFRSRVLRIRLADERGTPSPPGRIVRLHCKADPRTPEGRTGGAGDVAFPGLGPGPWRVTLVTESGDRALGDVTFGDGDRELERRYTVR